MAFTPLRGKPAQANTPTALGHKHGASTASITAAWNATTSPGRCGTSGGSMKTRLSPWIFGLLYIAVIAALLLAINF